MPFCFIEIDQQEQVSYMQCMGWSFTAGGLLSKMMLLLMQLCVLVGNRLEKDAEQLQQFSGHNTALRSVEQAQILCKSYKTRVQQGGCCCCFWSLLSSSFTDTNQLHSSCLIIFSFCPNNQFTVSIAAFLILSASSANQGLH